MIDWGRHEGPCWLPHNAEGQDRRIANSKPTLGHMVKPPSQKPEVGGGRRKWGGRGGSGEEKEEEEKEPEYSVSRNLEQVES